jgi:hypothetical protein
VGQGRDSICRWMPERLFRLIKTVTDYALSPLNRHRRELLLRADRPQNAQEFRYP